jgi:hypothetical protein
VSLSNLDAQRGAARRAPAGASPRPEAGVGAGPGGAAGAALPGASLKELMARLGHSRVRAAMIYQHATRDRDRAIARALGELVREVRQEPAEAPEDQRERGERDA